MEANLIIIRGEIFVNKNATIDKGASFCHVVRIRAGIHDIDVITEGYHRWHGAIPIFIINEIRRIIYIEELNLLITYVFIDLMIRSLDPRAWTKKYFTAASVSW